DVCSSDLAVGHDHDHVIARLGRGLHRLVQLKALLLRFDRSPIAVQVIDDRIALARVLIVSRRRHHQHFALGAVAFEIAFDVRAMDLDPIEPGLLLRRGGNGGDGGQPGGTTQDLLQQSTLPSPYAPISSRPISMRLISLVPAPMSSSLASRRYRSTGQSVV